MTIFNPEIRLGPSPEDDENNEQLPGSKNRYGSFGWLPVSEESSEVEFSKNEEVKVQELSEEEYTITETGRTFDYEDLSHVLNNLYPDYDIDATELTSSMEMVRKQDAALLVSKFKIDNPGFSEDFGDETLFTYSIKGVFSLEGTKIEVPRTELKKISILDRDEFTERYVTEEIAQAVDNFALAAQVGKKLPHSKVYFDEGQEKFVVDETKAYFDGKNWKTLSQDVLSQDVIETVVKIPDRDSVPQGAELEHGFSKN